MPDSRLIKPEPDQLSFTASLERAVKALSYPLLGPITLQFKLTVDIIVGMKILCIYIGQGSPRPTRLSESSNGPVTFHALGLEARTQHLLVRAVNFALLMTGFFDAYLHFKALDIPDSLDNYDGVICHDLLLLPKLIDKYPKKPIVLDLREFYPEQFSSRVWLWSWGRLYKHICQHYAKHAEKLVSVSPGVAALYKQSFNLDVRVIPSYAHNTKILPRPTGKTIKLVHHGNASEGRRLENMIEAMDFLDNRFTLDLFLVPKDANYYQHLQSCVAERETVQIQPPVAFDKIIQTLSKYDIGLFTAPPTTINLQHSLPNKIFEFIQARLMLVVSPLDDVSQLVHHYSLGLVTADFAPQSIARVLRSLTNENIDQFKSNVNLAAESLNSDKFSASFAQCFMEID